MLYISPDLGWANRTRMLNPIYNDAVVSIPLTDLVATLLPDIGYIGPGYRVITTDSGLFLLPISTINGLMGNNLQYVYRAEHDVAAKVTILRKSTGAL